MNDLVDTFLVAASKDVFATMLSWELVDSERTDDGGKPGPIQMRDVNGSIGFGGKLTGNLFLCCTNDVAAGMARAIFGSDEDHSPKEISDVVGEMTNMLAGGCKTRLCNEGYDIVMSIPNIITGKGIRTLSKDTDFMVGRRFALSGNGQSVDVVLLGKFQ